MMNNNLSTINEETKELENNSLVIRERERDVTISLARYEELICAEQKLVILCRSIHSSNDYEADCYRVIVGEDLLPLTEREKERLKEAEKARKQSKEGE